MNTMDETALLDILSAPLMEERPWAAYAACAEAEGMTFYPQTKAEEREALALCEICPVRVECLDHAIDTNERFGIWGGTTEKERRQLTRIG